MYCLILPEFIVFVLFFGIGFAKIIASGLYYFGRAILFIKCWFVMKDIQLAQQAYEQFLASFNSLILGSCSVLGEAEASYAPFIRHRAEFYIYVSELALHTNNLLSTGKASVLFIEPEESAQSIFARKRASFQVHAREVPRETSEWSQVMSLFVDQFGSVANLIASLADFHLIALSPVSGRFVSGFASAYTLRGEMMQFVDRLVESKSIQKDDKAGASRDA